MSDQKNQSVVNRGAIHAGSNALEPKEYTIAGLLLGLFLGILTGSTVSWVLYKWASKNTSKDVFEKTYNVISGAYNPDGTVSEKKLGGESFVNLFKFWTPGPLTSNDVRFAYDTDPEFSKYKGSPVPEYYIYNKEKFEEFKKRLNEKGVKIFTIWDVAGQASGPYKHGYYWELNTYGNDFELTTLLRIYADVWKRYDHIWVESVKIPNQRPAKDGKN